MAGRMIAKQVMPMAAALAVGSWVYLWFTQKKAKR